ncbi:MAG TPA: autotransporter-associated beta strand repeat-containing protein, partial [Acidimicrobiia bacterium]|nr:autotransporter-associated beta strand repeat-containing protein [Acidimicrobiia bacterium]
MCLAWATRLLLALALGVGGTGLLSLMYAPPARAATTLTWDGGDLLNVVWSDATNWNPDLVPSAGDRLVFPAVAPDKTNTNDLAAGFDIASLSIDTGYTISGNAIDLTNPDAQISTTGTSTFAPDLTLSADTTISGTGTLTLSGVVSGSGVGLTMSGSGTVTLSGANTYTGSTTVTAGTLRIGAADRIADASALNVTGGTFALNGFNEAVGSLQGTGGTVSLGGNTLTVTQGSSQTFAGVIAGAGGALTKTGASSLTLSGNNTYTGATTVSAGTLLLSHANALGTTAAGTTVASGATLELNDVDVGAEALTLNGG